MDHTQVWEHDDHSSQKTDVLHGRDAVHEFLAERVPEAQDAGIEHTVHECISNGQRGAFIGEVEGPDGRTRGTIAWLEFEDGKIKKYVNTPARMPELTAVSTPQSDEE